MLFGLREDDIDKINSVFAHHPNIKKVILYGSRAKGNYKPCSDIDLSMVGDNLDLQQQVQIEMELDALLLPYKIDLSILTNIKNENLLNHIERVGKVFFEK